MRLFRSKLGTYIWDRATGTSYRPLDPSERVEEDVLQLLRSCLLYAQEATLEVAAYWMIDNVEGPQWAHLDQLQVSYIGSYTIHENLEALCTLRDGMTYRCQCAGLFRVMSMVYGHMRMPECHLNIARTGVSSLSEMVTKGEGGSDGVWSNSDPQVWPMR
jgi:hypothetical protein